MTTLSKQIVPGSTIGIIGGGQLGRMMAFSAKERGYRIAVLDPVEDCPTAQVADFHIKADYDDTLALKALAAKSDVLTYEFENVDAEAIKQIEETVAVPQGTDLLLITQNRLQEKEFLNDSLVKIADYAKVDTEEELREALKEIQYPSVLKTIRGGYDGKGQCVLRSEADIEEAKEILEHGRCVLEKWLTFQKEISVMVVRNARGDISVFPAAENIHVNNILSKSIVPARVSDSVHQTAREMAETIAEKLNLVGALGIEMFLTQEGTIYANELAPRPHNSGHYSIEACSHSQFDMHIRAICGYALPKVDLLKPAVMVNVLGEHLDQARELNETKPFWHIHEYGKAQAKSGRKMGHITILTEDIEAVLNEIKKTKIWV